LHQKGKQKGEVRWNEEAKSEGNREQESRRRKSIGRNKNRRRRIRQWC
jgi:hypothetical protein